MSSNSRDVCCRVRAESQPITLTAMVKRLKTVTVNDKMQRGYRYTLTAPMGRNFVSEFRPDLTPKEMLALGVFCGKYMTDCREEFPASWFAHARCSPSGRDCSLNFFGVDASQPLSVWRSKGWIYPDDPRGWFQWYCRYYMGRRMLEEDARQMKRWKKKKRIADTQTDIEPHFAGGKFLLGELLRRAGPIRWRPGSKECEVSKFSAALLLQLMFVRLLARL